MTEHHAHLVAFLYNLDAIHMNAYMSFMMQYMGHGI